VKLDFGCGDGGFDVIHQDRVTVGSWTAKFGGPDTIGIDVDGDNIRKARERINNGTIFMEADGRRLPFVDSYFDIAHVFGVMHHIHGYEDAVRELARVMKSGGVLYITETTDDYFLSRWARHIIRRWQKYKICSFFYADEFLNILQEYFWTEEIKYCWRPLICDALRVVEREPAISLRWLVKMDQLLKKLGLEERFCCHLVVKAIRRG